jgi:predicted permease
MVRTLVTDIRRALIAWRRRPALALAVTATLALALAAALVVAGIVRAVLLSPLPYAAPERLAVVQASMPGQQQAFALLSGPELAVVADRSRAFATLGGVWTRPGVLRTDDGQPAEEIEVGWVTDGFLETLAVSPALGRLPTRQEAAGRGSVILLSDGLWRQRYGADANIVGRRIEFDDERVTVIGVMPASFRLWFPAEFGVPAELDAWLPWGPGLEQLARAFRVFTVVGRLADDSSWSAARAELDAIGADVAAHVDYGSSGFALAARPLADSLRAPVRPVLALLAGIAVLVVLIACANVAHLLLSRAQAQRQELRVRIALGAGRATLWRQHMLDVGTLAAVAGAGGLAVTVVALGALRTAGTAWLPRLSQARLDAGTAMTAVGLVAMVTIAIGAVVAWTTLAAARRSSLHDASRGGSRAPDAARRALVVVQIALSVVLAIGAGLMVRTFVALHRVDLGFDPARVVSMRISLPDVRYPYATGGLRIAEFYRELDDRLRALPAIQAAGATLNPPLSGRPMRPKPYAYRPASGEIPWGTHAADYRTVTPGWFAAVSARLIAGRFLDDRDRWDRPIAVVVDTALADRAWPARPAIGQAIRVELFREGRFVPTWGEVVGVVAPIRMNDLATAAREQVFIAHHQSPQRTMYPAVLTTSDPLAVVPSVQAVVGALEPGLPAFDVRLASALVSDATADTRFALAALAASALVALVLATTGVYAAMAFMAGERRREIGIRIAIGASPASVRRLIVRQGARLILIGTAVGFAGAAATLRLLASLLYGVTTTDPATFACVSAAIAAAGLTACWLPAQRASAADPWRVLR